MGVLKKTQLDQIWHENGMKFNVRRFHKYLAERGLLSYVKEDRFSRKFYNVLQDFFVKGVKERADGRQTVASSEGNDANAESENS